MMRLGPEFYTPNSQPQEPHITLVHFLAAVIMFGIVLHALFTRVKCSDDPKGSQPRTAIEQRR